MLHSGSPIFFPNVFPLLLLPDRLSAVLKMHLLHFPKTSHLPHPLLLHSNLLKRINRIPLRIIQLQPPPILQRQAILLRIIKPAPPPPPTPEFNLAGPLCALDPEADVNAAMDLVDLALDPRILARKVYFVAELVAHERVRAQGVEGGCYDGGLLLLVVEEGEEGD